MAKFSTIAGSLANVSAVGENDKIMGVFGGQMGAVKVTDLLNSADAKKNIKDIALEEVAWGVPIKQDVQTENTEYGRVGNLLLWETFKRLSGCYLVTFDGSKAAKLARNNRGVYADGTALDESKGNIMHYTPRLYFYYDTTNGTPILWMSLTPLPDGHYIEEQWVGCYNGSLDGISRLRSVTNQNVANNKTITEFWNYAQNNQSGGDWGLASYQHCQKWLMMALSESGNTNSQEKFGYGPTGDANVWSQAGGLKTGATAEYGDECGRVDISAITGNSKSCHVSFFGIENPYGWYWQMTQGITFSGATAIVYNGNRMPNAQELAGTAVADDRTFARNTSSGWVKKIIAGEHFDIFPTTLGGDNAKGWCDYSWANTTGQLFLFGGSAYDGANCGLAYVNSHDGFGLRSGDYGARLAFYGKPRLVDGRAIA